MIRCCNCDGSKLPPPRLRPWPLLSPLLLLSLFCARSVPAPKDLTRAIPAIANNCFVFIIPGCELRFGFYCFCTDTSGRSLATPCAAYLSLRRDCANRKSAQIGIFQPPPAQPLLGSANSPAQILRTINLQISR